MAGENLYVERVLYGAPYLSTGKAESDESKVNNLLNRDGIFTFNPGNIKEQMFNTIDEHIDQLTIRGKDAANEMEKVANTIRKETLSLFDDDYRKMRDYLKILNTYIGKLEPVVEAWAHAIVTHIVQNVKEEDIGTFLKNYKNRKSIINDKIISPAFDNMIDKLSSDLSTSNKKTIKDLMYNELFRNLLNNNSNRAIQFYYSRPGGTAGEIADIFTSALAGITDEEISADAEELKETIKTRLQNISPLGREQGKADTLQTIGKKKRRKIIFSTSVKNYALTLADGTFRDNIKFSIHSGSKPPYILRYITNHIDGTFKPDNGLLELFNTFWVNAMYLYGYGIEGDAEEIKTKIQALLSCYGAVFLAIDTRKSLSTKLKGKGYSTIIESLIKNYKHNALFVHFTGFGIIPIFELIDAINIGIMAAKENITPDAGVSISYNSVTPIESVDRTKPENPNDGIKVGTRMYYGSSIRDTDINNMLTRRYNTYVSKLNSITIHMDITGSSLSDLLQWYGASRS